MEENHVYDGFDASFEHIEKYGLECMLKGNISNEKMDLVVNTFIEEYLKDRDMNVSKVQIKSVKFPNTKPISDIFRVLSERNIEDLELNNVDLDMFSCNIKSAKQIKKLSLSSYKLKESSKEMEMIIEILRDSSHITSVDLSGNQMDDVCLKKLCGYLASDNTISNVNLSNNRISNEGIKYLVECININLTLENILLGNQLNNGKIRDPWTSAYYDCDILKKAKERTNEKRKILDNLMSSDILPRCILYKIKECVIFSPVLFVH